MFDDGEYVMDILATQDNPSIQDNFLGELWLIMNHDWYQPCIHGEWWLITVNPMNKVGIFNGQRRYCRTDKTSDDSYYWVVGCLLQTVNACKH